MTKRITVEEWHTVLEDAITPMLASEVLSDWQADRLYLLNKISDLENFIKDLNDEIDSYGF